jgi:hypothetical protein
MNNNNHLFLNDSLKNKHLLRVFTNKNIDFYYNIKNHFHEKFVINKEVEYDFIKVSSNFIPNSGKLSYFIKEAYYLIENNSIFNNQDIRINILNNKWKQMSEMVGSKQFNSYIPFIDVSFHHDKESLYSGIALAILISEHSSFQNRIMIIDQQPLWINFENHDTFFSKIITFHKSICSYQGTNSNILKGMELLIDSFIETFSIEKLCDINIVFLHGEKPINFKKIKDLFYKKGIESNFKIPLPCPSILFWSLSQRYIDNIFVDKNFYYLSGLSPFLLSNLYLLEKNRYIDSFQFISNILGKKYYDDIKISRFIL